MTVGQVITPEAALSLRERLIKELPESGFIAPDDETEVALTENRMLTYRILENWLREARVLIWDDSIYDAAFNGFEVFEGTAYEACVREAPPQIWFLKSLRRVMGQDSEFVVCYGVLHWNIPAIDQDDEVVGTVAILVTYREGFVYHVSRTWYDGTPCPDKLGWVTAGLHFLDLPFVAPERATLPRHIRRAAELERRPPLPEINVVTLRRAWRDDDRPKGDGEPRDWSCQWIVGGHWRNQWYPKAAEWKPKYIAPYLKGDPDKPLRQPKGTVYQVTR